MLDVRARRIADSREARSTDWNGANPVTVKATPYQTLSLPDQRLMTISYVSPRVAANSTTLSLLSHEAATATCDRALFRSSRSRSTVSVDAVGVSPDDVTA